MLSVLFDDRCKRKAGDLCHFWRESVLLDRLILFAVCFLPVKLFHSVVVDGESDCL